MGLWDAVKSFWGGEDRPARPPSPQPPSLLYRGVRVEKPGPTIRPVPKPVYVRTPKAPEPSSPPSPWRKLHWQILQELKEKIEEYTPPPNADVPQARILMIGMVGAGKSSFVNTINSIFSGVITHLSPSGCGDSSFTTVFRQYQIRPRGFSEPLKFCLCDMCGIEVINGPSLEDFKYLLAGSVPDMYQFNPKSPINTDIRGFVRRPGLAHQVHCAVFVFDATVEELISVEMWEKFKKIQAEVSQRGIPRVILLTKIDKLSKTVEDNVCKAVESEEVHDAVKKFSQHLGIPLHNVHPIKNYENEVHLNNDISRLALIALEQILEFANGFLDSSTLSLSNITPWRQSTPHMSRESLWELREKIEKYTPVSNVEVRQANILMIGQIGAGKSSFFNTINSIFSDAITHLSPSGSADRSFTTVFRRYQLRPRGNSEMLKFCLCDTCGIEENEGPSLEDLNYILDGNVPDGYQFNPSSPINPDIRGFKRRPGLGDQVHCVAFVLDATAMECLSPGMWNKLKQIQAEVSQRGIPRVILLTKVDSLSRNVEDDVSKAFESKEVYGAVNKVSAILGIPRHNIHPIKNYEDETCLKDEISSLALIALEQMIAFANDYLNEKSLLLSNIKPWRKPTPHMSRENLLTLMEKIENYRPPSELRIPFARIAMIGPVGAGKSSFFNTVDSLFRGRISQRCMTGSSRTRLTTEYRQYKIKGLKNGKYLNFCFCDTCGIEENQGPDVAELMFLIEGNVPDPYKFNPSTPISPDNPGFIKQPRLKDKVHCAVFVFDATSVDGITQTTWDKLNQLQTRMHSRGLPRTVLLTKIDQLSQQLCDDVSKVFHSEEVHRVVVKVSHELGIQPNTIHPIKNYETESDLDDKISVLSLLALDQILGFASDFLSNQPSRKTIRHIVHDISAGYDMLVVFALLVALVALAMMFIKPFVI